MSRRSSSRKQSSGGAQLVADLDISTPQHSRRVLLAIVLQRNKTVTGWVDRALIPKTPLGSPILAARLRQAWAALGWPFTFPRSLSLLDWERLRHPMARAITKDANILGGEPVFRGTRVPFKILIDYLEGGDTLDQFLEQYPSVSRELAIAAIEEAKVSLVSQLR